ncbi:GNAT family N-acetyltransferase [Pararhizobium haloflavum]|uniref:GNAT family N-acetyltransferase n=1 Tax=Pararhizobium haloflavum TaxID=2037914 RepID=UPI000C17A037|nr:GNAT family protein [Pararhizobium haloflavum]
MLLDLEDECRSDSSPDERRPDCPVLLTERLVLRRPHLDDADALANLANNLRVASMVSRMPHPYTHADAEDFIRRAKTGGIGKCVYAVTIAETGEFVGCAGIEPHADEETVELGYWIGEAFWNRGYATEAAHAVIDMIFRTRDVTAIEARCRVTNPASRRVIQKSGFQHQGNGMVPSMALGGALPVEWYRLDRKTWLSLRSWAAIKERGR